MSQKNSFSKNREKYRWEIMWLVRILFVLFFLLTGALVMAIGGFYVLGIYSLELIFVSFVLSWILDN